MDDFSDDDLDGLNLDELSRLENKAIHATQAPTRNDEPQTTQLDLNYADLTEEVDYGAGEEGDAGDYDSSYAAAAAGPPNPSPYGRPSVPQPARAQSYSALPPYKPPIQKQQRQQQQQSRNRATRVAGPYGTTTRYTGAAERAPTGVSAWQTTYNTQPYSQGGSVQPAQQQQPFQQPIGTQFTRPPLPGTQTVVQPSQFARPPTRSNLAADKPQTAPSSTQDGEVEDLKNQIRALEADLNSARGEISIVRSKQNRLIQDHDQEVQRMKRLHATQLTRQEDIAKLAQRAERSAATELEFVRRDLREEVSRAHRKDTTPKRTVRPFGAGDGFSDAELAPSPSKSQGRSRNFSSVALPIALAERTPSKAKRKRPPADSPLKPLELEDPDVVMGDASQADQDAPDRQQGSPPPPGPFSHEYIKMLLDHRSKKAGLGTFEVMAKYALPNQPDMPFTNIYLHKIPSMGSPGDPIGLLADFATFTLELWNDCLAQQYYEPVLDLLDLVIFTLYLGLDAVPRILHLFIPVAQTTCLTIMEPRHQAANGKDLSDEYHTQLANCIDVGRIVSVMRFVALACATAPIDPDSKTNVAIHQYWCLVDPKLVSVGLDPKQPIEDYLAVLKLLQTSALATSIGPIATNIESESKATPEAVADSLIDRLTNHLRTRQSWGKDADERCVFTFTVLQTLIAFATSPFGLSRFVGPQRALARLVCLLCAYVDELYQSDAPLSYIIDTVTLDEAFSDVGNEVEGAGHGNIEDEGKEEGEGQAVEGDAESAEDADKGKDEAADDTAESVRDGEDNYPELSSADGPHKTPTLYDIISSCMLLLHTIIMNPKANIVPHLQMRLEVIPGSWERYLVTLARLEFADEDMVLERGIDAKTLDMAHELLDQVVTPRPELGEQIVALFGDE